MTAMLSRLMNTFQQPYRTDYIRRRGLHHQLLARCQHRLLECEKDEGYTETVTEYSYDDNGNQVEKEVWIDNSFDSSETSVYKMEQPSDLCRRAAI